MSLSNMCMCVCVCLYVCIQLLYEQQKRGHQLDPIGLVCTIMIVHRRIDLVVSIASATRGYELASKSLIRVHWLFGVQDCKSSLPLSRSYQRANQLALIWINLARAGSAAVEPEPEPEPELQPQPQPQPELEPQP